MENKKSYIRRKNSCFWNVGNIEYSISSSSNQNPLPSSQRIRENTKVFSLEKFYLKNKTWNTCEDYKDGGLKIVYVVDKY